MQRAWWKESVVYQIYPRSFYDSDGDGIGDLPGITQKLDYLQQLGVDVIWLCPVYQSPNDDNGYDISDYQAIQAEFGSMEDWEQLLAELHRRGMKLLMDLVVNHTSDEHAWFRQARSAKDNPYRDYYIWRPGRDGGPPNNWESLFGGSAWEHDPATDEYYLHLFSRRQPDLNWENPAVRQAIYAMMHWWLDKGVDGFRLDAINLLSKAPGLPDAPVTTDRPYQFPGPLVFNGPRLLEHLLEMKREVLAPRQVFSVGETSLVTTAQALALTQQEDGPLNMVFQFEHMDLDKDDATPAPRWYHKPWNLVELKQLLSRWQHELDSRGWNSQYLGNHDLPRAVSRFGDDQEYRVESATLLATLLHMLQGTPYIYQGEEIGMTNVAFETIDDYRDIETLQMYREFVEERGLDPAQVMSLIHARSRDNARTPIQWDGSAQAGFTRGTPWIQVNPNYPTINVAQALADPQSIFAYYQRLIQLRKAQPAIVYGRYELILDDHPEIYAFTRSLPETRLLVLLNFSGRAASCTLPEELTTTGAQLLIGNYAVDPAQDIRQLVLRPFEARVYRIG
jgi:oligo-1,6-glucosidase